jgi:hypothetical protein
MIQAGVLNIDPNCCDGKEIAPGIWGIGRISWHADAQQWRTLANVGGALCLIEVKLKPCSTNDAEVKKDV